MKKGSKSKGVGGFVDRHPVWSFLALLVVTGTAVSIVQAARGTNPQLPA